MEQIPRSSRECLHVYPHSFSAQAVPSRIDLHLDAKKPMLVPIRIQEPNPNHNDCCSANDRSGTVPIPSHSRNTMCYRIPYLSNVRRWHKVENRNRRQVTKHTRNQDHLSILRMERAHRKTIGTKLDCFVLLHF